MHKPNLCVAQQVCTKCLHDNNLTNWSQSCGIREHIFKTDPVAQMINLAFMDRRQVSKTTCIAHNARSYDGQFF